MLPLPLNDPADELLHQRYEAVGTYLSPRRRHRIARGSVEVQMRKAAGHLFGFMGG